MLLSVAIVNWNTTDLLVECLRSIHRFPPPFDYQIIVVDNASSDFSGEAIRSEFPDVQIIVNNCNEGYAKGNNQAIEAARGDYILLLNPDTRVTPGALANLVAFMQSHEDAAAAGAKLVRPSGEVDRSVRGFPYPGPIAWEMLGLSRLFPNSRSFGAYRMTYFSYNEEAEVDQPMGACLILSAAAVRDIGLLDESFPIFFNDVDWLYRAKQKGYKVYFTPDAVVVHHGAGSTSKVTRRKMVRESHDSLIRFYEKHFKGGIPPLLYYFTIACIKLSRLLRG